LPLEIEDLFSALPGIETLINDVISMTIIPSSVFI